MREFKSKLTIRDLMKMGVNPLEYLNGVPIKDDWESIIKKLNFLLVKGEKVSLDDCADDLKPQIEMILNGSN